MFRVDVSAPEYNFFSTNDTLEEALEVYKREELELLRDCERTKWGGTIALVAILQHRIITEQEQCSEEESDGQVDHWWDSKADVRTKE